MRSSSATSYLPHTGDNVHILLNTLVTRILPVGNPDERDLRKVEFATSPSGKYEHHNFVYFMVTEHEYKGPRHTLTAGKELILSGGVINSPQVLLNSGIGPEDELRALGIKPFINNPSVGKNFSDQLSIPILFPTTLDVTE
jgi:choline dehydrogenase-like flavoprotein